MPWPCRGEPWGSWYWTPGRRGSGECPPPSCCLPGSHPPSHCSCYGSLTGPGTGRGGRLSRARAPPPTWSGIYRTRNSFKTLSVPFLIVTLELLSIFRALRLMRADAVMGRWDHHPLQIHPSLPHNFFTLCQWPWRHIMIVKLVLMAILILKVTLLERLT